MIQKVIKKSSEINPKSMEVEAWTGLGDFGGRLGSNLGSQARLAQNEGARLPKTDRVWAPILGSVFDIFRDFAMFFGVFFLVSILMATRTDFSWILIIPLDHV